MDHAIHCYLRDRRRPKSGLQLLWISDTTASGAVVEQGIA